MANTAQLKGDHGRDCATLVGAVAALSIVCILLWMIGSQRTFTLLIAVLAPFFWGLSFRHPLRYLRFGQLFTFRGLGINSESGGSPEDRQKNATMALDWSGYAGTAAYLLLLFGGAYIAHGYMPVSGTIMFLAGALFARFCDLTTIAGIGLAYYAVHGPEASLPYFAIGVSVGVISSIRFGSRLHTAQDIDALPLVAAPVVESAVVYSLAALVGAVIAIMLGLVIGLAAYMLGVLIGAFLRVIWEPPARIGNAM